MSILYKNVRLVLFVKTSNGCVKRHISQMPAAEKCICYIVNKFEQVGGQDVGGHK